MAVARERLEKGTIPMTQKIYNDGVKIIGLALRSMIKVKEAQRSENEAVEMYWKKEGCGWFPPIKRTQDQIEVLQNILHNIDGCKELMPIFDVTEAPQCGQHPTPLCSSEERTGLLKHIADLEAKLAEADKSFRAQGNRFQKSGDERTDILNSKDRELEKLRDANREWPKRLGASYETWEELRKELSIAHHYVETRGQEIERLTEQLPPAGELTYKAVCQSNDRLRDQNNNLALELAKQLEGSRSLILVNEELRDRAGELSRALDNERQTSSAKEFELKMLRDNVDALKVNVQQKKDRIAELAGQVLATEERYKQRLAEGERHLNSSIREEGITKRALKRANETIDELCKTNNKVCDERDILRKELDFVAQEHIRVMSERATEALDKSAKATPVDTGAVKEDILRLRVVLDTSDVSSKLNKLTEALKD